MTPTADGQGTKSRLSKAELAALAPTRSAHREVQTGLFVLAGAIAVVVALFLLTDPGTFRGRYYVSTVVEDAGGIRKGDPVQLRGVNVGRVRSFEIVPGGVEVRLELEQEYAIPADSRVVLRSAGLLGGLVADVVPGTSEEPLEDGDVLPSSTGTPGLEDVATELSGQAEDVLARAQALLSDETVGAVGGSTQRLESLLTELDALATEQRGEVRALTASLRRSAAGVEAAATQEELRVAIARTDSITRQLDVAAASLTEASASLATVMQRIEAGEGTLGRLTTDESLYDNLNATAVELRTLAQDIRENPKRYINVSVF